MRERRLKRRGAGLGGLTLERETGVAGSVARPRADRPTARPSRVAAEARSPGAPSTRAARLDGLRATHEKISTEPPIAPAVPTQARQLPRARRRLRGDDVGGERRCDHRRDELRSAPRMLLRRAVSPPFSYVPIEMCSAPWYAARSGPRSARAAGRNATPAAASSRVPGESRERRRRRAATVGAEDRSRARSARSNGKRACGSRPPHHRQECERLSEDDRPTQDRHARACRGREVRLAARLRRAARRRHRERRSPTRSARARARRSGEPFLRACTASSAMLRP